MMSILPNILPKWQDSKGPWLEKYPARNPAKVAAYSRSWR